MFFSLTDKDRLSKSSLLCQQFFGFSEKLLIRHDDIPGTPQDNKLVTVVRSPICAGINLTSVLFEKLHRFGIVIAQGILELISRHVVIIDIHHFFSPLFSLSLTKTDYRKLFPLSTSFLESFLASGIESVHLASDFFPFPFARQIVQLFDEFLAATVKRIFNHVTASLNVSILSHRENFLGVVLDDKNFSVAIIEVQHFLSPFLSFVKFNLAESVPFVNRFFYFLVEHEANKHGAHTETEGTSNAKTGCSTFAIVMGGEVAHKNVEETEKKPDHNQEPLEVNHHFLSPLFSLSH